MQHLLQKLCYFKYTFEYFINLDFKNIYKDGESFMKIRQIFIKGFAIKYY